MAHGRLTAAVVPWYAVVEHCWNLQSDRTILPAGAVRASTVVYLALPVRPGCGKNWSPVPVASGYPATSETTPVVVVGRLSDRTRQTRSGRPYLPASRIATSLAGAGHRRN